MGGENARSLGQPSSSYREPRVRETDAGYATGGQGEVGGYRGEEGGGASGQLQPWTGKPAPAFASSSTQQPSEKQPEYTSGGSNMIPYIKRDNRCPTIPTETMGATANSSRFPPNSTTLIPQHKEGTDPSLKRPFGAFPPTRPPQHETQYSHPSQAQGPLDSQRQENTWDNGLERPSGGQDLISNPSGDATGPHPWGDQPTGPPPGWSADLARRMFFPPSLHQNF